MSHIFLEFLLAYALNFHQHSSIAHILYEIGIGLAQYLGLAIICPTLYLAWLPLLPILIKYIECAAAAAADVKR